MLKHFSKNGACFAQTVRKLHQVFGRHKLSSDSTVSRLISKFETKFTLIDQKTIVRRQPCRSLEKLAAVNKTKIQELLFAIVVEINTVLLVRLGHY